MALPTAPLQRKAVAAAAPSAPMLRVRQRDASDERFVPLPTGKLTIGSSPQCQVCLPSPEVLPLQCLITRQGNATFATRWAPGVQLNGNELSKAELRAGDRLTIGDWRIEFSDDDALHHHDAMHVEATSEDAAALSTEPLPAESPRGCELPSVRSFRVEDGAQRHAVESQTFADRLVLELWTANYNARHRAKGLLAGIRAARFQSDAMAADIAAIETELDLARAAYDSHLGNNERRKEELAELLRDHQQQVATFTQEIADLQSQLEQANSRAALLREQEQRAATLTDEMAALRLQLEAAGADVSAQAAERDKLASELTALQAAPRPIDLELARLAEELDAAVSAKTHELEQLAGELQSVRLDCNRLAVQLQEQQQRELSLQAETAEVRSQLELAQITMTRQAADHAQLTAELTSLKAAPPEIDPALALRGEELEAAVIAQAQQLEQLREQLQQAHAEQERLGELYLSEAARSEQLQQIVADHQAQLAAASRVDESQLEGIGLAHPDEKAASSSTTPPAPIEAEESLPAPANASADPERAPSAATTAPASPPAPAYSPPSFIEQYRHLLDDEGAVASDAFSGQGHRAVIDDEFLSPAKVETCASPPDDSDEALEAYMANMMRRMRSSAPTYTSSQAAPGPDGAESAVLDSVTSNNATDASQGALPPLDFPPDEPFTFEAIKHATRKPALASDLAALREIANASARTAIATHAHQQNRNSATTKIAIALTAVAAAAYLFISAPAIGAWQVWAGAATGAVGMTATAQLLLQICRGDKNAASSADQHQAVSKSSPAH